VTPFHGDKTMDAHLIQCRSVAKAYRKGQGDVVALKDVNWDVAAGEFVALMGPSGSGKSTLLHLLAGLDSPTAGTVKVAGAEVSSLPHELRARWRARNVAIIFQSFNLVPVLTAAENVDLPLALKTLPRTERRRRVRTALELVGLGDRADHRPHQLSYGQEQRVAIARALVTDPPLLLADEPTGNLDSAAAEEVMGLFQAVSERFGTTIVMVTHDPRAAQAARTVRRLDKGMLLPAEAPAPLAASAPASAFELLHA
jgi:putative ABC transport system ATP-binding protein